MASFQIDFSETIDTGAEDFRLSNADAYAAMLRDIAGLLENVQVIEALAERRKIMLTVERAPDDLLTKPALKVRLAAGPPKDC